MANWPEDFEVVQPPSQSDDWQPIESAPSGVRILVSCLNRLDRGYVIVAEHVAKFTVEASWEENDDDCDYDEAGDTYYTKEGWRELAVNSEYSFGLEEPPTHWMPLPPPPKEPK